MFSRSLHRMMTITFACVLLMSMAPGALAQDAGVTPRPFPMALTTDAYEGHPELDAEFGTPVYYGLAMSDTGGGTHTVPCNAAAGAEQTLVWASPAQDFLYATTLTDGGVLTIGVSAGATGAVPGVQTGSFSATLNWGYTSDQLTPPMHQHPEVIANPEYSATSQQLVTGAPSMAFNVTFPGSMIPMPSNTTIFFSLSVSCGAGTAVVLDFSRATIASGAIYGRAGDTDTDGDGIPDSLDDDADGDGYSEAEEAANGTSDLDAFANPGMDADGDGYTLAEETAAGTSDEDPNEIPGAGGLNIGLILLILLAVLLIAGGAFAALAVVNKSIKLEVSHDGFQAIEQGEKASFTVTATATSKKEETFPVVLGLKGVPEDWTATLSPDQVTLTGGPEPQPVEILLTVVPPTDAEFEQESAIVVTATPTDEEGKTSAMKPGASIKTKTIVNIGVTPEEGTEGAKKAGGFAGKLKFKKKDKSAEGLEGEAETDTAEPEAGTAAAAATGAPSGNGKPRLAMGKMSHDPEDFASGDQVTTTIKVQNKGDGAADGLRLRLLVNDEEADSTTVDLGPGQIEQVTFNWTAGDDENRVKVKGEMPKRG